MFSRERGARDLTATLTTAIEDPALIGGILAHRKSRAEREHEGAPFGSRASPPQRSLV